MQRQINHTFIANTPKCSGANGCKLTLPYRRHCSWRRGVAPQRDILITSTYLQWEPRQYPTENLGASGAAGKLRFIKASNCCCHIVLRHVLPRPVRGDSPCGGCWGCSPQRCELDAASSRTLGSPTTTGSSVVSTKKCISSTACRGCCAFGRKMLDETLLL